MSLGFLLPVDDSNQWNVAYYGRNNESPFNFKYESSKVSGVEDGLVSNAIIPTENLAILTYEDNINFREQDKVWIDGIKYMIISIQDKTPGVILNSPWFKSSKAGKVLYLGH